MYEFVVNATLARHNISDTYLAASYMKAVSAQIEYLMLLLIVLLNLMSVTFVHINM